MSKYCIACYNTPEDCTCYPNRKPKDNQGDWEEQLDCVTMVAEDGLICPSCRAIFPTETVKVDLRCKTKGCDGILMSPIFYFKLEVKDFIRELLKKQKEEIIVKAEGYRNTYDALGKFIEDLSNS